MYISFVREYDTQFNAEDFHCGNLSKEEIRDFTSILKLIEFKKLGKFCKDAYSDTKIKNLMEKQYDLGVAASSY
jgi:hypothetical protein